MVTQASHRLRLSVAPTEAPSTVRFIVEDAEDDGPGLPLASGYRSSVGAAMDAAEDAADRISKRRS
jgi:hypothetical protein